MGDVVDKNRKIDNAIIIVGSMAGLAWVVGLLLNLYTDFVTWPVSLIVPYSFGPGFIGILAFAAYGINDSFHQRSTRQRLSDDSAMRKREWKKARQVCERTGHDWWYLGTIHRECKRCRAKQTQDI